MTYRKEILFDATFNGTPSQFAVVAQQVEPRFVVAGARYPADSNSHPLWGTGALRPDANPVTVRYYSSGPDGIGSHASLEIMATTNPSRMSRLIVHCLHWDEYPEDPKTMELWRRLLADMEQQAWIATQRPGSDAQPAASGAARDLMPQQEQETTRGAASLPERETVNTLFDGDFTKYPEELFRIAFKVAQDLNEEAERSEMPFSSGRPGIDVPPDMLRGRRQMTRIRIVEAPNCRQSEDGAITTDDTSLVGYVSIQPKTDESGRVTIEHCDRPKAIGSEMNLNVDKEPQDSPACIRIISAEGFDRARWFEEYVSRFLEQADSKESAEAWKTGVRQASRRSKPVAVERRYRTNKVALEQLVRDFARKYFGLEGNDKDPFRGLEVHRALGQLAVRGNVPGYTESLGLGKLSLVVLTPTVINDEWLKIEAWPMDWKDHPDCMKVVDEFFSALIEDLDRWLGTESQNRQMKTLSSVVNEHLKTAVTANVTDGLAKGHPSMNPHADVLLVTVTQIESQAVFEVFQQASGQAPKPISVNDRIYHNLGVINGANVFMVQSEMGSGGPGGTLQTVERGIKALSPSVVIMVGIAFGVDETKQNIGDVLVSKQLMLYDLQRVSTKDGEFKIIARGDRPHASVSLLSRFRSADYYWDKAKAEVRFGLILSGDKLVDNIDYRSQLLVLEPEAIGGEMEGAGLYGACQDAKVDWILVKAICDWADGQKSADKDQRQQLAAHNAADFLLHVLQLAPLKPRDPTSGAGPKLERELIERGTPSSGTAETNGQSGGVEIKGGKVAVGGDWVGRDKVIYNLNQHDSKSEIALNICLLADNFRDEFRQTGSSWVSGSEADQLRAGQNVFGVRQNAARETLEKLSNLSQRAKYLLDCGELVEEKVAALRRVFNDYSLNLESYIQQSRIVGEQLNSGIFISQDVDAPRMQLIEEIFRSGWQKYFNSVSELVQGMTGLLKKYTIQ